MELPQSLKSHLAKAGFSPANTLFVQDWTGHIGFLEARSMYWIVDPDTGRSDLLASFHGDNDWVKLNHPPGLTEINNYLRLPDLHDKSKATRFIRNLIAVLHDPRFVLCDVRLAQQPDVVLETYLNHPGGGAADLNSLRELCVEQPDLRVEGNQWSGRARVLDFTGAIMDVTTTGHISPDRIDSFVTTPVTDEGTFYFADEF